MSETLPHPPIVHSSRQTLRDLVAEELAELGHSKCLNPKDRDDCIEVLVKNPDSVLIIDWSLGAVHVNAVLASIKGHFLVETRPIFLVIEELVDEVVATGAEYGVSQIHAGPVERESIKECLGALFKEASLTKGVRAALVTVADARARKDWRLATALLEELHGDHPDDERVSLEFAENLIVEGRFDQALGVLQPIAAQEQPNIRSLHLIGRCYLAMGKVDEAIELLTRAKIINPHNIDRLIDLGNAFFKNNQIDEAMENFEQAGTLDEGNKAATVGKSKCLLMTGDVNEALALMKTVSGPREMASIFNTAAVLAIRVGQFEKGMSLYKSAINALGKNDQVASRLHFNMGLGYRRWSKLDRALTCFARSLELDAAFEKAARHKRLTEAALGVGAGGAAAGAAAEGPAAPSPQGEERFDEEDFGGRPAGAKAPLPKDDELFEDD